MAGCLTTAASNADTQIRLAFSAVKAVVYCCSKTSSSATQMLGILLLQQGNTRVVSTNYKGGRSVRLGTNIIIHTGWLIFSSGCIDNDAFIRAIRIISECVKNRESKCRVASTRPQVAAAWSVTENL